VTDLGELPDDPELAFLYLESRYSEECEAQAQPDIEHDHFPADAYLGYILDRSPYLKPLCRGPLALDPARAALADRCGI
jgi:hypothetical protein